MPNTKLEQVLRFFRRIIPKKLFRAGQPIYHYSLAVLGALIYRFPSKSIYLIAVTGTKGKSTTTELMNAVLEAAGFKTALLNTIRFKIGDHSESNNFKMTLPGRFFLQSFLRQAVEGKCTHAIIEMSSEAVLQFRHRFIELDALIFTNLAPEHIESHGSYENYVNAKVEIARILEKTAKPKPVITVNKLDKEASRFITLDIENKVEYSLDDAFNVVSDHKGSSFQTGKTVVHSKLAGELNVANMLGVFALSRFMGIEEEAIKRGLESLEIIRGRMERIDEGQNFDVVVDYAHTPDSLRAIYEVYREHYSICVLGNTGGGRDKWKRAEMGKIANNYCEEIILTNEDPYDEDPRSIVEEMHRVIDDKKVRIIMDRRNAIFTALKKAQTLRLALAGGTRNQNIAVLITGKGTDPYIMGPNGSREKWDDATVAREELRKIVSRSK